MAEDVVGRDATITHLHNPPLVMADVRESPWPRSPTRSHAASPGCRSRSRRRRCRVASRRPPGEQRSGADYDTDWARRYPARVARVALVEGVVRPAVAVLARPERHGLDRLDDLESTDRGPVIFAANHHSHVDTPLLLTTIPEPWRHQLFVGGGRRLLLRHPRHERAVGAGHRCHPHRAHQGQPALGRPGRRR